MLSFKQFLIEGAKMTHGSANAPYELLPKPPKRNPTDSMDTLIGTHYAADPEMSKKFREGLYGRKPENPATFETRRLPRSQTVKVHGKGWDQTNIAKHVNNTVFNKPDAENKRMFNQWAQDTRRVTSTEADRIYDALSKGQKPNHYPNESRDKKPSVGGFINFYDPSLHHGGIKLRVADKYRETMQAQGKKGIVYVNTSPNETRDGVRSKKSYIIFDPSKLPHEKKE